MNEIFLDTETTGLSPNDRHKIVEIACIETNDFTPTKRIHNASFDLGFLNHELKLVRKNEIKKDNIVDSLEVARGKFPGASNSLDALCRRFGIDLSRRTKHNALLDCELLREVYINLLDAKEPKLIFSEESTGAQAESRAHRVNNYCKTIVKPTEEEIKLHRNFLKKELKKNYY